MNALAQLSAIAGEQNPAFAGVCDTCGRGMFRRGHKIEGHKRGWIGKVTSGQCMTCYKRAHNKKLRWLARRKTGLTRGFLPCEGCGVEVQATDADRDYKAWCSPCFELARSRDAL